MKILCTHTHIHRVVYVYAMVHIKCVCTVHMKPHVIQAAPSTSTSSNQVHNIAWFVRRQYSYYCVCAYRTLSLHGQRKNSCCCLFANFHIDISIIYYMYIFFLSSLRLLLLSSLSMPSLMLSLPSSSSFDCVREKKWQELKSNKMI